MKKKSVGDTQHSHHPYLPVEDLTKEQAIATCVSALNLVKVDMLRAAEMLADFDGRWNGFVEDLYVASGRIFQKTYLNRLVKVGRGQLHPMLLTDWNYDVSQLPIDEQNTVLTKGVLCLKENGEPVAKPLLFSQMSYGQRAMCIRDGKIQTVEWQKERRAKDLLNYGRREERQKERRKEDDANATEEANEIQNDLNFRFVISSNGEIKASFDPDRSYTSDEIGRISHAVELMDQVINPWDKAISA